MAQYVGVSFRRQGQIYYFLATPFVLSLHDWVLVKTEEGIGFGEIVALRDTLPEGLDLESIKPIYRPATAEDVEIGRENDELAKDARKYCQKSMARMNLDMKLVDVEIYFDKSKMIFYFTAPGRVDFRELVKDLVRNYRTRIELRQIGVRHETQMIGALGNCGQMCCCRRYLRRFEPVTIKMAKDQTALSASRDRTRSSSPRAAPSPTTPHSSAWLPQAEEAMATSSSRPSSTTPCSSPRGGSANTASK